MQELNLEQMEQVSGAGWKFWKKIHIVNVVANAVSGGAIPIVS